MPTPRQPQVMRLVKVPRLSQRDFGPVHSKHQAAQGFPSGAGDQPARAIQATPAVSIGQLIHRGRELDVGLTARHCNAAQHFL